MPIQASAPTLVAPLEPAIADEPEVRPPLGFPEGPSMPGERDDHDDRMRAAAAPDQDERAVPAPPPPSVVDVQEIADRVDQRVRRVLSEAGPGRFDGERFTQSLRMLEQRLAAVQDELRAEREAVRAMEAELGVERERAEAVERAREVERLRAEAAETERARAREETQAYRRVLAAAIANEKYALDHAAQSRREVQARARALEEAARARGAAEGRAQELERRVEELSAPRPLSRSSFARAAGLLAVALLLAGVALAQWGAAWSSIAGEPSGDARSPSAGLHLALGTGAFALAAFLWILWEREVRRMEEGNGKRPRADAGGKTKI